MNVTEYKKLDKQVTRLDMSRVSKQFTFQLILICLKALLIINRKRYETFD